MQDFSIENRKLDENVLQTYETPALGPDQREYKYYAPGLGLVLIEEGLNEQLMDPEFTMELTGVQMIPEPMSLSQSARRPRVFTGRRTPDVVL